MKASIVRMVIATCLMALGIAVAPAIASAEYPWTNQEAMQNESSEWLRSSFIIDTNAGAVISRQVFLSKPYLSFYEREGFDRNFFAWAPLTQVGDGYIDEKRWTGCKGYSQEAGAGPWAHCSPGGVKLEGYANLMRTDVEGGGLTGFKFGETFVSNICGNWSPANAATKASLTPSISGTVYQDFNANGARDNEDTGLGGWTIQLYLKGAYVTSTRTTTDGSYSIALDADTLTANGTPIGEGTYELREVVEGGWHEQQRPSSIYVKYGIGSHDFSHNDFGDWRDATISGFKWDDRNVDGIWEQPSENGISEWQIGLSNGQRTVTGQDGAYSFSIPPGSYTVSEEARAGWRQTSPRSAGTHEYEVSSGEVVEGANFGNVCLGGVDVEPIDDATGASVPGMTVRLEEFSVPGILKDEPPLPWTTTGTPDFGELLPGTYRVTAFLPEGLFTTDLDAKPVEGRFAFVKEVVVNECEPTKVSLHMTSQGTPGKVTGGVKIALHQQPDGSHHDYATAGLVAMSKGASVHGVLQYGDHAAKLALHTDTIEALSISGDVAFVWGKVDLEGAEHRFRLRLVDAGEPGSEDHFELTLDDGYEAGQGESLLGGNIKIHS